MRTREALLEIQVLMLWLLFWTPGRGQDLPSASVRCAIAPALEALLADEDTDGDWNITIDDPRVSGTFRGDRRFLLRAADGRCFEVAGTSQLSNLLAALKVAQESGKDSLDVAYDDLSEPPALHIARAIRERYWTGLTRTIDEKGLGRVFGDEKSGTVDGSNYVYVPHDDAFAMEYYRGVAERHPAWKMQVVTLPAAITPEFVRGLDGRHGILTLGLRRDSSGAVEGIPFVVPGGRFNEMYGWDSYFIVLGLLHDGRVPLAKSIVDNFVYEIDHYGKILNANRTYYLTRSQPPFLSSMARAVYARLPRSRANKRWLRGVLLAAVREYTEVWTGPEHLTSIGLSRYSDTGIGPPPEVETGRFDTVFARAAREMGLPLSEFRDAYAAGAMRVPQLDRFFRNDRAMRESGHDASYRLIDDCADLATVDLNSLLYKTESDIATILDHEFSGSLSAAGRTERSGDWRRRAGVRRELVIRYLWDERRGMFFDYNVATGTRKGFVSAATFYPLWSGLASHAQASRVVAQALPLLTMPGGIAGSTEGARGPVTPERPQTQWDYPFGWAPHQMLVWSGLRRYHYNDRAAELAYRWLYMIASNACNYNGTIAEKYDVVSRSARVFAEYGNVGTTFSYITREGFGWTNASIVVAQSFLSKRQIESIDRLVPPEWYFLMSGNQAEPQVESRKRR